LGQVLGLFIALTKIEVEYQVSSADGDDDE